MVPISKYPDIVKTAVDASDDLELLTPCVGHASDGNLQYTPVVARDDDQAVKRALALRNDRVVWAAIDMGGTATGEHGAGRRKFLAREHGVTVDVMAAYKDTLDSNGIMNPGNILPDRG